MKKNGDIMKKWKAPTASGNTTCSIEARFHTLQRAPQPAKDTLQALLSRRNRPSSKEAQIPFHPAERKVQKMSAARTSSSKAPRPTAFQRSPAFIAAESRTRMHLTQGTGPSDCRMRKLKFGSLPTESAATTTTGTPHLIQLPRNNKRARMCFPPLPSTDKSPNPMASPLISFHRPEAFQSSDVLFGNCSQSRHNPGNHRFVLLVNETAVRKFDPNLPRVWKRLLAQEIMDRVEDFGGRFFQRTAPSTWTRLTARQVQEKILRALLGTWHHYYGSTSLLQDTVPKRGMLQPMSLSLATKSSACAVQQSPPSQNAVI